MTLLGHIQKIGLFVIFSLATTAQESVPECTSAQEGLLEVRDVPIYTVTDRETGKKVTRVIQGQKGLMICRGKRFRAPNVGEWKRFLERTFEDQENSSLSEALKITTNQPESEPRISGQDYLSGLIIGYELRSLLNTDISVFLCGGDKLSFLYAKALQCLKLNSVNILPADTVDNAVIEGHLVLAERVS